MNIQLGIGVVICSLVADRGSEMVTNSVVAHCWSGWFAATGTFAVAVIAIWGNWFRAMLAGPKLRLVQRLKKGVLTDTQGAGRVIYHQLVVINERSWSPAKNCHVLLRRIERLGPDRKYHKVLLPTPVQLQWCFPGSNPLFPTIVKDKPIDLVRLPENKSQGAVPCLYFFPLNFDGFVGADECIRYHLEIVSDEFISKTSQVFEVAWDGQWNDDMSNMQQHLTVREVTP